MDRTKLVSKVWFSADFTKRIAALKDDRQDAPHIGAYVLPSDEAKSLCAHLILEEALETINALGFGLYTRGKLLLLEVGKELLLVPDREPDLLKTIDGCCDTIYVSTGTLVSCGVPDLPHLEEVCRANDSKFPGGVAITDPQTGKYLKPEGWVGPDHARLMKEIG